MSVAITGADDGIQDFEWIRQSIFVPKRGTLSDKNSKIKENTLARQYSFGSFGFEDTGPGGGRAINMWPQFTEDADPNMPSFLLGAAPDTEGNPSKHNHLGMGYYYAEAISNNYSKVTFQFGVPAYNSMANFLTTFYDPARGNMANTGVIEDGLLASIGGFLGMVVGWFMFPVLSFASFAYSKTKMLIADVQHKPLSKYYYMKPTMALYWDTVQIIINAIAVNMKLATPLAKDQLKKEYGKDLKASGTAVNGNGFMTPLGISEEDVALMNSILPDIYMDGKGGIDIRRMANRYSRLAVAHNNKILEIQSKVTTVAEADELLISYINGHSIDVKDTMSAKDYNDRYRDSAAGTGKGLMADLDTVSKVNPNADNSTASSDSQWDDVINYPEYLGDAVKTTAKTLWGGLKQHFIDYGEFLNAEMDDGSSFVNFNVVWDTKTSESWDNRTRESDIAQQMNSFSSDLRAKKFNFSNGNVGDDLISNSVEALLGGVGAFVRNATSAIGLSSLAGLGGKAFVDIPDFWEQSVTNFGTVSYDIPLRTWAGNPLSILQNIYIPFACLLAGAAPRSTGNASYSGPFLCKIWQQGRVQISLGIISNLNAVRGSSNIGWSVQHLPTGIDVSITVINLSKMLHVPITTDTLLSSIFSYANQFEEDTNFTDYMAILGALNLESQYYFRDHGASKGIWRLRRDRAAMNVKTQLSVESALAHTVGMDTLPGRLAAYFTNGRIHG